MVDCLVKNGHHINDVLNNYTIDQVIEFYKVSRIRNEAFIKEISLAVRMASLPPTEYKRYIYDNEEKMLPPDKDCCEAEIKRETKKGNYGRRRNWKANNKN